MKHGQLDEIDKKILFRLSKNARTPVKDIAQEVFLTSPAVSARIQQLERDGYLLGYHAAVNPLMIGYHIKAFIRVEVQPADKEEFYPFIRHCSNVVQCDCITGDFSMLLEVYFESTHELDVFIGELQRFGRTMTQIVFSTAVEHRVPWIEIQGES